MSRIFTSAAAAAFLALTAANAQAFCRDDLKDLEPRIKQVKNTSKERYALANHWWTLAQEYEPISETQCLTYAIKAQRALLDPLIQVNDCAGPNAYLQRCNNGGLPAGGPAYAPPGLGPGGGGGGGGPVVAGPGPAQPFTPPGPPGGGSPSK
jgi:hypothetical protein